MAIGDDFAISSAKIISYTGTTVNYTVLAFHRWLQDLADDAQAVGDDLVDITSDTPTDRSTDNFITLINGYTITATAIQHLYDGSIVEGGGTDIWDGIVNYGTQGMHFEIMQNGALATNFWTTGLNADVGQGISHRFLIKVRSGGADIDGRRLIGMNREYGNTYGEFSINGTARGNNVLALVEVNDLNNATIAATVATWTTITNTEGYRLIDVNNDATDEAYYSEWNRDTFTINQFTERMKWLTRRGTASTLYGLAADLFRGVTHEIDVDTPTGTFSAVEAVSWTGGTGQMFAINSPTAATKMWIQLLTGVVPTDGLVITGGTSSATVAMNVTITDRTLSYPFFGQTTGSAIRGAYGFGLESADLAATDQVTDLTDTVINPPNNVTFTVNGLVSTEDRLLLGPEAAGTFNKTQFILSVTLSGATETAVVSTTAIPSDTPATGTIRIILDSGIERRIAYTSFTGSTFTIASTDFSTDNATSTNNMYLGYIDKLAAATSEAVTWVYSSDRALFVRARDGGGTPIKTFESPATMGTNGGSITIIRTPDA